MIYLSCLLVLGSNYQKNKVTHAARRSFLRRLIHFGNYIVFFLFLCDRARIALYGSRVRDKILINCVRDMSPPEKPKLSPRARRHILRGGLENKFFAKFSPVDVIARERFVLLDGTRNLIKITKTVFDFLKNRFKVLNKLNR